LFRNELDIVSTNFKNFLQHSLNADDTLSIGAGIYLQLPDNCSIYESIEIHHNISLYTVDLILDGKQNWIATRNQNRPFSSQFEFENESIILNYLDLPQTLRTNLIKFKVESTKDEQPYSLICETHPPYVLDVLSNRQGKIPFCRVYPSVSLSNFYNKPLSSLLLHWKLSLFKNEFEQMGFKFKSFLKIRHF
jgi:hypothetical protein